MALINKYNTFVQRLSAGIIDALVFIPFLIVEETLDVTENKELFIGYNLTYIICWTIYCVIGHGKYGQTIGKKVMKIKVYDLDEKNLIGYKRAFFRESVGFFVGIAGITWVIFQAPDINPVTGKLDTAYNATGMIVSSTWFLIELITMALNSKRRAVHDFLAGSVVIDLKEAAKQNLKNVVAS